MATLSEVKDQRKAFNGRETYERFVIYCKTHEQEVSPENLLIWDQKYNDGALVQSFGSKADNLAFAYLEKCRRFLVTYSMRIPNGAPVTLSSGKKYQPIVHERRMVAGRAVLLRDVNVRQAEVIRDQFRIELRQLLRTQKFFNLPAADIRRIANEVLDAELADKE